MSSGLEIRLGTDLRAIDATGADLTPRRRKECALIALLALSPARRRSRAWLQDKLWSDRTPERGGMSMRRALSNIRGRWAQANRSLGSDARSVWLAPDVAVTRDDAVAAEEFLVDLGVDDPEFLQWLREVTRAPAPGAAGVHAPAVQRLAPILIGVIAREGCRGPAAAEIETEIIDLLSERLQQLGPVTVVHCGGAWAGDMDRGQQGLEVEVGCDVARDRVRAQVRLLMTPARVFLWAGRAEFGTGQHGGQTGRSAEADVMALVNTVVTATLERSFARFRGSLYFQIQHASGLLFTGQRRDVAAAETVLSALADAAEAQAIVPAWRGFQRVTSFLEFGGDAAGLQDEATGFAGEALRHGQTNPLALALAAQIEMKLAGDLERADHLATRAVSFGNSHPYALAAAAHSATLLGRHADSYRMSKHSLAVAAGLPNEFIWHMQCALASLAVGDIANAREHARRSHLGMAGYRPALRYMAALALIDRRPAEAEVYAARLRRIEPGFTLADLRRPDYPVDTLRALGLQKELWLPETGA